MSKTILITGATDGIGLETAKRLLPLGHTLLLHGRSEKKLEALATTLNAPEQIDTYIADFSDLSAVKAMADSIAEKYSHLDVIINNTGVLKIAQPKTLDGFDVRFVVNTFAPHVLTSKLMPLMNKQSRVVNVSSAAQSPVDIAFLQGQKQVQADDLAIYAQSKLAITMWSNYMANRQTENHPLFVAVNPGSLLASKMVKEGFGMEGKDIGIGADILIRAAVSDEFEQSNGLYFDNDLGAFADPHADALDSSKCEQVVSAIQAFCNS